MTDDSSKNASLRWINSCLVDSTNSMANSQPRFVIDTGESSWCLRTWNNFKIALIRCISSLSLKLFKMQNFTLNFQVNLNKFFVCSSRFSSGLITATGRGIFLLIYYRHTFLHIFMFNRYFVKIFFFFFFTEKMKSYTYTRQHIFWWRFKRARVFSRTCSSRNDVKSCVFDVLIDTCHLERPCFTEKKSVGWLVPMPPGD